VSLTGNSYHAGILIILISCFLLTGTAAAQGIQAYMGDTIPLSGYSPSSPYVYLFLTGPNLPENGVALNNINLRADQGGFTRVAVDGGNDMWSYKWGTNSLGGRLDEGTYTVWVVNGPEDRSNLGNAEYATISVTLGSPTLSVAGAATPAEPPTLQVSSEPADASVSVNGQYLGRTPFSTTDLAAGTSAVTVSRFGYLPYTTSATLVNGAITVINATLPAENGALAITTDPPGAFITIDGKNTSTISPATIPDLAPGNHTVTVTREGYTPSELQVTITAGSTRPLTVALSPVSPLAAVFPMRKTPAPIPGMLLGLCAATAALAYCRRKSR
jgi:PEGA domain